MGFFKSFFTGKQDSPEEVRRKAIQKEFEIFKYDGMRAQRMGRADYAVKCYTEALKLQSDFETMGYLAQVYMHTGEMEKARALLEKMVQDEPLHANVFVTLANVCESLGDYAAMAGAARQAIDIEKDNATAHYLLGKADEGNGDRLMCVAHYTRAIALKDDFVEARLARARVLMAMAQYKEAGEDVAAVLAGDGENVTALLLRGEAAQAESRLQDAECDYRQVIALNPFEEKAYLLLSNLLVNGQRTDETLALLDEAIEMDPNSAALYGERGRVRLAKGDKEGALEDMKKSMELNPQGVKEFNGEYGTSRDESAH